MNSADLAFTPAIEQAQLLRNREVSPVELVELYLARIDQLNPHLGSYFTVMAEAALADAKAKAELLAQASDPSELPPFLGVPISVKDLNPLEGVPCTYGNQALKQQVATYDDNVVTRIKQAGFIILGKTATSEFGTLPYSEPAGFAPARNPWNPDYTPGGSSGGAAASVAAGLSAIAQGSDGGGSIRGPAFCCGLVGIKPSRGRISCAPIGEHLGGLAANGPLARTVADAAALLDVLSGYVPGDPYWLPDPNPSFLAVAQAATQAAEQVSQGEMQSLRIGYCTSLPPFGPVDETCQQAVQTVVTGLEALGHQIEPMELDVAALLEPFQLLWQASVAVPEVPPDYIGSFNRWLLDAAPTVGGYLRARAAVEAIARRIVATTAPFDAVVLPTYCHTAIRVGEWADCSPADTLQRVINWVAPCPAFNASGQPTISIPTGFDPQGVPVGVQIIGRPAQEATLITLAAQLEVHHPWIQHRPSLEFSAQG